MISLRVISAKDESKIGKIISCNSGSLDLKDYIDNHNILKYEVIEGSFNPNIKDATPTNTKKPSVFSKELYKEWCVKINRYETKTTYLGFITIYKLSLFGERNKYRLFRSKSKRITEHIKH